jgi:DNA-binding GntR family transcriptional regulator
MRSLPALQPFKYHALSREMADSIREAILAGTLPPGHHLVEGAIAAQMGVSRAPVREAIQLLQSEGLVVSIPRKGAFVIQWTRDQVEELYQLRMALEGISAWRAATKITPEECQALQGIIHALGETDDLNESVRLDLSFHEGLCRAARSARLAEALGAMHSQTELFIRRTRPSHRLWGGDGRLFREHQAILDAVCIGNPELAEREMRSHIRTSGERMVRNMQQ